MAGQRADWALHAIGKSADQYQVTKQADVLMLLYLFPKEQVRALFSRLGYAYSDAGILRTAHYYLARSTHRSSLSRVVYASALAQLDPAASWDFYRQALANDLDPSKGEGVAEGIHLGSMGGSIDILQRRYLGIDARADGLSITPACPGELGQVRLALRYRGNLIEVEYDGDSLRICSNAANKAATALICRGERRTLHAGQQIALSLHA
jgi:trehalose/maltose hydrolase-like predicted phosphorylase